MLSNYWTNIISGGYRRLYLAWFKSQAGKDFYPADIIIEDLRSRGFIPWIQAEVTEGLDEDEPMEAFEIQFIVPDGLEWNGISDYVMSFPEQESKDTSFLVLHLARKIPAEDSDGTLYIRFKDKKIERWGSYFDRTRS